MRLILSLIFISVFGFQLKGQDTSPEQLFRKFRVITVDSRTAFNAMNSRRSEVHRFSIDGWDMTLVDSELFTEDYVSKDHNGNILREGPPDVLPMNGYTDEGYRVSITIAPGFIYGFIKLEDEYIYLEPYRRFDKGANPNDVIIYNSSDIKEGETGTCGYKDVINTEKKLSPNRLNLMAGLCYDVEYVICNDWLQVNHLGGVAQAELFATGVTNMVNLNYDDEFADELRLVIPAQYSSDCSTCDPWTSSTDPYVLLPNFRSWGLSNITESHDVASLWTKRNFDGSTIGLAYVGAVCESSKYNVLENWVNNNSDAIRLLTSHELGHNFGASHDGSGGNIMASSINIGAPSQPDTWSAASIASIESYYSGVGCLSLCTGSTPQVNFNTLNSSVNESGQTGTVGPCNEPYTDLTRTVDLSVSPEANVQVSINVNGSSTASQGDDFELITTSLTFTPTGSLSQNITIRVYDDKIEEPDETIILNLNITSGTADLGPFDTHTMTIQGSNDDIVSSTCCSGGGQVLFDNPQANHYQTPVIFRGGSQDAKTRTIIPASELQALGLTAGEINSLSLYVYAKNSSGSYQNFRIGIFETNITSLSVSVPWYSTTQVFMGTVTTTLEWNTFEFDTPFTWDGTSNLYIDFCFNNTTSSSNDNIITFNPGTSLVEGISFRTASNTNGCNLNSGNYTLYYDRHPVILFTQPSGAIVEESVSTSNGKITVGNTAHFYSPDDEVMLSIKNIGSTNMNCVDVNIITSGSSKSNLPFGSSQYSNKTFQIDADNNALYEVTFYYSDAELTTWGADADILNIIQSSSPIASSNAGNSDFILSSKVMNNLGAGAVNGYKAIVEGSGYFALTDGYDAYNQITLDDSDFCIEQQNSGIVLTNEIGDSYLIGVDPSGNLELTAVANPMTGVETIANQLIVSSSSRALIFRRSSSNYTKVNVDNDGNIITVNTTTASSKAAKLMSGNGYITEDGAGLVFINAQNECWKMFVDNGGNLVTSQIPCN